MKNLFLLKWINLNNKIMLINLKCEIQELFGGSLIDIDFNKINIYVGQNGTGKTVLLKLAWLGTYITSNKILEERGFLPQNSIQEDFVNHTISKVFDEVDFNGKMVFTFENNLTTTLIFEKGICIDITFSNLTKENKVTNILFMSKELRLFTELVRYLKLRKRVNGTERIMSPDAFEEILDDYKIYDALAVEHLLQNLPLEFSEEVSKVLVENYDFKKNPTRLEVNLETCSFLLEYSDNTTENVLKLGAGHQSILNMFAMNSIQNK